MGKSTVVNRLARRFKDGSIVFDESGVTRDRTYKRAWYGGKDYDVVDTGGLVFDDKGGDVFAKEVLDVMGDRFCGCRIALVSFLRERGDGRIGGRGAGEDLGSHVRPQEVGHLCQGGI